jgi:hypothetical protein
MQLLATATCQPIDARRRQLIRELLERSDPSDPLVEPLTAAVDSLESSPCPSPTRLARASVRLRRSYARVVAEPWFPNLLAVVFLGFAIGTLAEVIDSTQRIWNGHESAHVIAVAGMASSLLASVQTWIGIVKLRSSRLEAYRWWDHALLLQVFITEVFEFLQNQFGAVFGLLLNMALLLILRTMIHMEHHMALLSEDPLEPVPEATQVVT